MKQQQHNIGAKEPTNRAIHPLPASAFSRSLSNTGVMDEDDSTSTSDSDVSLDAIVSVARDIQNRSGQRVGAEVVEARYFKEYFGVSAVVVLIVWDLLVEHDLLPEKGQIKHLLWMLVFLKVYPKQGPVCSVVGGKKGAIDPKTFRKWVWTFIFNKAFLDEVVVS